MAVMNDYFKPGDRVKYVGGNKEHHGNVFTIVSVHDGLADVGCGHRFTPWTYNLRHIPAPEVITINRDDLVKLAATSDEIISNPGGKYDGILADAAKLRKEKKADVITINRADLPEVKRWGTGDLRIGYSTYAKGKSAAQHRQVAMEQLAIAEYLDAQAAAKETADKEAADRLAERRDEIAREVAKKGNWYDAENTGYVNMPDSTRITIDMIIRSQDEAKQ